MVIPETSPARTFRDNSNPQVTNNPYRDNSSHQVTNSPQDNTSGISTPGIKLIGTHRVICPANNSMQDSTPETSQEETFRGISIQALNL